MRIWIGDRPGATECRSPVPIMGRGAGAEVDSEGCAVDARRLRRPGRRPRELSGDREAQRCRVDGKKVSVTNTHCLVSNFVEGECVYADSNKYEFDVPCSDTRATAKVTKRVEQGSGVTCGVGEKPLTFNPPGRTYCLTKP